MLAGPFRTGSLSLVTLLLLLVSGCGGGSGGGGLGPPIQDGITIDPDSVTLIVPNDTLLTAQLTGGRAATFTWQTGDPDVATVDQTGLVTAVHGGKTVVIAAANGKQGQAVVTVLEPGSGCDGVDTVEAWNGTLTMEYADSVTSGPSVTGVKHLLDLTFTLQRDAALPPGAIHLRYLGVPTGTASIDESVTDNNGVSTNLGAGTPDTNSQMRLLIDTQDCTWQFLYSWGVNATVTIKGASPIPFNPELVGQMQSAIVPLGTWQQQLSRSGGFPVYGAVLPTISEDAYFTETEFAPALFGIDPATPRGPAAVDFKATPK